MTQVEGRGVWARRAGLALALVAACVVLVMGVERHYPAGRWLVWRYLMYWALAGSFSLACVSAGLGILEWARPEPLPLRERLIVAMALGVLVFHLGMFVGGLLRLYSPAFGVALPILVFAIGARTSWRLARRALPHVRGALRRARRPGVWQTAALVAGLVGLLAVYVGILTPQNASYDARWYHLAIPEHYTVAGGIERSPEGWFHAALPQLASLVYAWPYQFSWFSLFDKIEAAAHLEFVLFLWTLASVGPLVRWLVPGARTVAAWSVFFLFGALFVYDANLNLGADHVAAFWAIPIYLALRRAWGALDLRWCAVLAALLAGAIQTKVQAIEIVAFPCAALTLRALYLAARLRRLRSLAALGSCGIATLIFSAPYWLKNWIWYGDPFYPALHGVLKLRPWHQDMEHFYATLVQPHFWRPTGTAPEKARQALEVLATFSFVPHDWPFMHRDWPVFGFLFTLSWLLMPFSRAGRRHWALFIGTHVGVVVWFLFSHQDRYLQILVPWMVAHVAAVIALAWRQGWLARVPLIALIFLQAAWSGSGYFIPSHNRIATGYPFDEVKTLFSAAYRQGAKNRLQYFQSYADVGAKTPANAKLLLHRFEPHAGFGRRIVMDHPSWQGLISYSRFRSHAELHAFYRSLGVTHIVWLGGNSKADDYLAGDLRFFGFVTHVTPPEEPLHDMFLTSMPEHAPSADIGEGVLYLACHGYSPGLYQLGDLMVHELGLPPGSPYPAPRLAATAANVSVLAKQSNYAVLNSKCAHALSLPPEASPHFVRRGHRFEEQLFVRRVPIGIP